MQDTSKSPAKLMLEFIESGEFDKAFEQFKSSNSPKKEWEVVEVTSNDGIAELSVYNPLYADAKMRTGEMKIHSVRRLSDQAIITKDEVVETPHDGKHHIGGFEIRGNAMYAQFSVGQISIEHLRKLPVPVLVTTDGVEIFDTTNFRPTIVFDDWSMNIDCEERLWRNGVDQYKAKLFSNLEAAQTYVTENRPVLSLKDVKEVASATVKDYWLLMEALSIKVKQKLNS